MAYVDGFVLPVPKKNLAAYRRMSQAAGRIWKKHGALEYREAVGDDLTTKVGVPFPKIAKAKAGETVVFSWIVYKSRSHRDKVNAKVMKDPKLGAMMKKGEKMPFDVKRMGYGGFKVFVDMQPQNAMKLTARDGGIALAVKVVPGASRSRIAGPYGDGIKVTVMAPPEGGAANEEVIALLAAAFGLPTASVSITRGHASPHKEVLVTGLLNAEVLDRLSRGH